MADEEQVKLLKHSVGEWNEWRNKNPDTPIDLSEADLRGARLRVANLRGADLREADLRRANLRWANLSAANLNEANLRKANLREANLGEADDQKVSLIGANLRYAYLRKASLGNAKLCGADLTGADLTGAIFSGADLNEATLISASLVSTNLENANLTRCHVYGASVWDIKTDKDTKQTGLIVSKSGESIVIVDDLEVAHFIYLLVNHKKLRNVLNAMTQKGVLILGRFGDGGLELLQAVAARIREMGYLPMLFDFERTESRDFTETVKTMVGLARFVIADLSGPSVLKELEATVPDFEVPFIPIIEKDRQSPSMTSDLTKYGWFRWPPFIFASKELLIEMLPAEVIAPAEEIAREREKRRAKLFLEAK